MSIFKGLVAAVTGAAPVDKAAVLQEGNKAVLERIAARKAQHDKTQEAGRLAYLAYYEDAPYARAKIRAGMVFTPEMVDYLEREVSNRKIQKEIILEETKGTEAQSHETPAPATSPAPDGSERTGDSDVSGPAGGEAV